MSKSKDFNLVPYVYGRLYAEQYYDKESIGVLYETSKKLYSWVGILYWLQKENYILAYEIKNVDEDTSVVTYKFNRNKTTYEGYIRKVERSLKANDTIITPMSEFIRQVDSEKDRDKLLDGFEAQFKKPVEYIAPTDRCLKELNKKIMDELEQSNNNSNSNDEEQKAA